MRSDSRAAQVVALAAEQGGVVTSRQARAVTSVSVQQLKRMVDSGVLERLHHGLYRLARMPEDVHLEERVAWLALDPGSVVWERLDQPVPTGVLSHRTAAALHRLGDLDADVVELTAMRRIRLSLPAVVVHRGVLSREDWQLVDGLPVTTPARTIADLAAAGTDAGHLASVVRDALTRGLVTVEEVVAVLSPYAFDYGHRALDGQGFLEVLIAQAGVPTTMLAVADLVRKNSTTAAPATGVAPDARQLDVAALMKAVTESPQARDALMRTFAAALGQSTATASDTDADPGVAVSAQQNADGTSKTGSDRTARTARSARTVDR
ncbi:type IV toxin-antitoxin system AbiEi family antitoxin domain-containing protein [Rhodococcus opacus]|uniref:Type IV toxin-antitoxin system AbiEi family antitoxin domain-containing protein n=1 Tax=Rhodococcus opacus TaxID=37919 RepID=A0ABT4NRW7_RHOOP|nr:type IV toxin-antitoxin system AbiEi family antitoxin domain-containing protein [Rhodococcus opacus]MCZ4589167.1 type IV toxin-antitoxin system AbiEi family antitoxin domain-containing protein [Rhodococcus opacus]